MMPLENSMTRPDQFVGCPGVLNIAMGVVIALYASVGFFGYLQYGDKVEASITVNIDINDM